MCASAADACAALTGSFGCRSPNRIPSNLIDAHVCVWVVSTVECVPTMYVRALLTFPQNSAASVALRRIPIHLFIKFFSHGKES